MSSMRRHIDRLSVGLTWIMLAAVGACIGYGAAWFIVNHTMVALSVGAFVLMYIVGWLLWEGGGERCGK